MNGLLFSFGYSQTGYWKYDSYQVRPTAEENAAIKPMPGRVHEVRNSGGFQPGPGSAKGSMDLFFKTDNADLEVYLATMSLKFGADVPLVTLVPEQKVVFDMSVSVGANDKSRTLGTIGSGTVAIDLGDYAVSASAKPDQTDSKLSKPVTIPGGGPGGTMMINVGAYLAHLGAHGAAMHIKYTWVDGKPPVTRSNLALNKPTRQSSRSEWSTSNDQAGAVDGKKTGGYGFHTNREKNPWWQVDLGEVKQISEIRIFNRTDCCAERARTIEVWLSNDGTRWKRIFANNGTIFGGVSGKPLTINVAGTSTRFVRLQLAETTWFHLDEVEVY